jgi:hypothetical protein
MGALSSVENTGDHVFRVVCGAQGKTVTPLPAGPEAQKWMTIGRNLRAAEQGAGPAYNPVPGGHPPTYLLSVNEPLDGSAHAHGRVTGCPHD